MASPSSALLRTPLNAVHRRLGARMVEFAGWDMPVQYAAGILAEHAAVRTDVGLFDLSHMGRVFFRGRDALRLAQVCCTRDLARLQPGEAAYSVLCQPDGGILDDVIGYVFNAREVLFVFNASNRLVDIAFFEAQRQALELEVEVDDQTPATALIGVQGPRAQAILQPLADAELDALPGYAFTSTNVAGAPALVSRTGYTGEDGFELMVDAAPAADVWTALQSAGGAPCGLGARDTLRTEAGFALYGNDIDRTTNPFEARLGWVVNFNKKSGFVGREALAEIKASGVRRKLVGLRVSPGGVPRHGFPVLRDGAPVGVVTSGTFSPTLKANIALGYVPLELAEPGQVVEVEMRGKAVPGQVTPLPFVPHRSRPRALLKIQP